MGLRNAVVTGASRGIGLELCRQLSENDAYQTIYALCRRPSEALQALTSGRSKVTVIPNIDVTMHDTVGTVLQAIFRTNELEPIPIDLLIHNAGAYGAIEDFSCFDEVIQSQTLENITPKQMSYTLHLNTLAPLFITKALLPNLRRRNEDCCSKVIIITSRMGSIADNTSGGHYAYRASKCAVNMIGKNLAQDLAKDRIAVGLVHPGMVFTEITRDKVRREGQRDVDESVCGVLQVIDEIDMSTTGSFLHGNYGEGVHPMKW